MGSLGLLISTWVTYLPISFLPFSISSLLGQVFGHFLCQPLSMLLHPALFLSTSYLLAYGQFGSVCDNLVKSTLICECSLC